VLCLACSRCHAPTLPLAGDRLGAGGHHPLPSAGSLPGPGGDRFLPCLVSSCPTFLLLRPLQGGALEGCRFPACLPMRPSPSAATSHLLSRCAVSQSGAGGRACYGWNGGDHSGGRACSSQPCGHVIAYCCSVAAYGGRMANSRVKKIATTTAQGSAFMTSGAS
jgi:hypothetical protein